MKRYTIIHPFFLSFFSKSLYRDVAENWKGVCFLYLLLLVALCWLPGMIKFHFSISDFVTNETPVIVEQIPEINIVKGKVSTTKPGLHSIKDPKTHDPLIIIDTTGKFTSLEDTKAVVLLTKTKIMIKKNKTETRAFSLAKIDSFHIDKNIIYSYLTKFKNWFAVVSYFFVVIFSFIYRVIQVLIYALIGILFTKMLHTALGYQVLIRLAVISITPVIILSTLFDLLSIPAPLWWLTSFVINMGFLFYAVKVNSVTEAVKNEINEKDDECL